jgi:hypothetical protein
MSNQKGQPMVEVEKVVRDLTMLFEAMTMSKFFRVISGSPAP